MASESTAADGSNIAANTVPNFSHVPWPVRPRDGINYDFVATLYLIGSTLALLFYLLETKILAPLLVENDSVDAAASNENTGTDENGEGGNAWKEFATGMQGMYFIFVPFVPCLLWSLVVRYFWMKETKKTSIDKKEN